MRLELFCPENVVAGSLEGEVDKSENQILQCREKQICSFSWLLRGLQLSDYGEDDRGKRQHIWNRTIRGRPYLYSYSEKVPGDRKQ
jgi:hypothetical protein